MASDPQGTVGRCWIERGVERLKLIVFTTYFTLLYFLSSVWIPAPGLRCDCPTFNFYFYLLICRELLMPIFANRLWYI